MISQHNSFMIPVTRLAKNVEIPQLDINQEVLNEIT
jgi:hypothetical protein